MQNNGPDKDYICPKCGWLGKGDDLELGDDCYFGYDLVCPICDKYIDFYQFPLCKSDKTFDLTNPNQLPDITGENLTFILSEDNENGKKDLLILHDNLEIWRESHGWEYHIRFMKIGKILKQKYGDRIIDFIPDNHAVNLFGDLCIAQDWIRTFRKQLPISGPDGPDISKYY